MSTKQSTIDYLIDQLAGVPDISARKMFGEYALYAKGKVVALVCDNQLVVKPTAGGKQHIGTVVEAPPYKDAKPCYLVSEDLWENHEWLSALIAITANQLPMPKPKKKKS